MIGIITFHAAHNCGSILQAYALQRTLLSRFSIASEIINFSNAAQRNYYSVFIKNDSFKHFVKNAVTVMFYKRAKEENAIYEEYIHRVLTLTNKQYLCTSALDGIEEKYSALICGSDQVWNITCTDADDAYFLSFANKTRKIAYATSLGAKNINVYTSDLEKYTNLIQSFASISVREGNGQKWIRQLINNSMDVDICLDPTLLLSQNEWEEITPESIIEGDYIFYYAFNYTPEVNRAVQQISKKHSMPVYMFDVKSWGVKGNLRYGFKLANTYGPEAFLSLIKHAKMVLTTSFHGTVFSTVFKKNFWYLNSSMHSKDDDRASYLLSQLGLAARLIPLSLTNSLNVDNYPDYVYSDEKIGKLREMSWSFIEESLRGINE